MMNSTPQANAVSTIERITQPSVVMRSTSSARSGPARRLTQCEHQGDYGDNRRDNLTNQQSTRKPMEHRHRRGELRKLLRHGGHELSLAALVVFERADTRFER